MQKGFFGGVAALILTLTVIGCTTTPSTIHSDLGMGGDGRIYFTSTSPNTPFEAFTQTQSDGLATVTVWGDLSFPQNLSDDALVPAVVIIHGSAGISGNNSTWIRRLNSSGFATFEINSYRGRGVRSTAGNQHKVRHSMMVSDAYNALSLLASHPSIDQERIGLMGFSKGGMVTVDALWERRRQSEVSDDKKFAAHLALYPACLNYEVFEPTGAPILYLLGGRDDWTPPSQCISFVEQLKARDYPAAAVVFDDAVHSFDSPGGVRKIDGVYNEIANCDFVVSANGEQFEGNSGMPMNTSSEALAALRYCSGIGTVEVGSTTDIRERAFTEGIRFFSQYLSE